MNKQSNVVIIGAGAAGLMCAIEAGKRGRSVVVIEKSAKIAEKIRISGGGRCNFTNLNTQPSCYLSHNPHFCKSALARYTPWHFIEFISAHGLTWQEKEAKNQFGYQSPANQGQLFCEQKSQGIINALLESCRQYNVEILTQSEVNEIQQNADLFNLSVNSQGYNLTIEAESVVIATGGPSIPKMGATAYGIQVAKQFGLKVYPFEPALVPLTVDETTRKIYFNEISGVSVWCEVTAKHQNYGDGQFKENLLITHRGLSGPAILQISSYWQMGNTIIVDLLPEVDVEKLLLTSKATSPNTNLYSLLKAHLPDKFIKVFVGNMIADQPLQQLSNKQISELASYLHKFELTPNGTEGMAKAEVSRGGVDTNELSSKTMQANKVKGLYFIGETVDVTGFLGGYNFQWAWASGWCAGQVV